MSLQTDLKYWSIDKNITDDQRSANITIHFKYPDITPLLRFLPKKRVEEINHAFQTELKLLQDSGLLGSYEVTGSKIRPNGVKADVLFKDLYKIEALDYVGSININTIANANKIDTDEPITDNFYTVKMTVLIEVEEEDSKMQDTEERYVMIKAKSFNEAYDKIEKLKDSYATPYLNPDGYLARWRIDSFDDCYKTDIIGVEDFENPEGLEVYSKLRLRKRKTIWDGNI